MRILVTGSRHAGREAIEIVRAELMTAVHGLDLSVPVTVVQGECPVGGIDKIAADLALYYRMVPEGHPAEPFGRWPQCGPIRNSHMVSLGADVCLAFPGPDSKGTWDCAKKAVNAGIRTVFRKVPR